MSATVSAPSSVHIRRALPADAETCGRICYEAFATLNRSHNFPPDFADPAVPPQILGMMFSHPGFFCVVAEVDGPAGKKIVGSNCLDERNPISGVGPITIDPAAQNRSIGRRLMLAVMERSQERGFAGIRLVQAAFHNRSLSLYTKLGFDPREPLSVMHGTPIRQTPAGYAYRRAEPGDMEACTALCRRVHGHDRSGELGDMVSMGLARVLERDGRMVAYTSGVVFFGHSVAENNADLQALIASAEELPPPGFLLPTRNAGVLRWCLEHGLRVVEPMTLMSIGLYNEPAGAWLPSISY